MQFLAERLANYAASLKYEQLGDATVHEVRRRLIDSFACALGAYRAEAPQIVRRLATSITADPGARYLGGGNHRTSPELAAFINGVLFRYLDYNDTYLSLEPAHPSDNLAAIIAAAQVAGASGKEVITAAGIAYEIQCRLCDAASIRARGWDHVTYGAFSATAAAGRLLRLKPGPAHASFEFGGDAQHHTPANPGRGTVALERLRLRERLPQRRVRGEIGGRGFNGAGSDLRGRDGLLPAGLRGV